MQRRGKHTYVTMEELLANGVFCWIRVYITWIRGQLELELREYPQTAVQDD
jgi:hypothetical protein